MQKNDIKSRCHAETNKKKKEKGEGPLTQNQKKTFFSDFVFSRSFWGRSFFNFFCRHLV
jgi:hypothetical protein